jgi:hypothetical protein
MTGLNNLNSSDQIAANKNPEVPGGGPALRARTRIGLVMVVIVVIPIAIRTPTVAIFIPPAMAVFPAPGTRFGKLMAILGGLRAVPSMVLGGLMEFVIRVGDASLAVVVCAQRSGSREQERSAQRRGRKNCAESPGVQLQLHGFSLVAASGTDCGEMSGMRAGGTEESSMEQ